MGGFRRLRWMICRTNWKVWKHKHLELCRYALFAHDSVQINIPGVWFYQSEKLPGFSQKTSVDIPLLSFKKKKTAFHSSFDGCVLSWQTHSAPHVCFTLQIKLIVTENQIFAANDWSTMMWCQRWVCFCERKQMLWEWERTFNYSHDPSQRLWYF